MAKIFEGCRALKSIDLSNFVTKNTGNMNSMFSQCTALESLNLSNFDTPDQWIICFIIVLL